MIKIKKGTKVLDVTQKAYDVIYADLGYTVVKAKGKTQVGDEDATE